MEEDDVNHDCHRRRSKPPAWPPSRTTVTLICTVVAATGSIIGGLATAFALFL